MKAQDFKTCRAVVIERPHEANLREIKLTEPMSDALCCKDDVQQHQHRNGYENLQGYAAP